MEEYVWDESVRTGHDMIDEQHKQLFAAINHLLKACQENKGKDELTQSLNFLNDYTIRHFFDEEQVQRKCNYPDYPRHKKLHDDFKATVRDLKVQLIMKGPSEALINEVRSKIGDWLVTHIKGNDIKLAAYVEQQSSPSGSR
ncbi:MAG: hemerythrin family protein [Treponema sp.]|jgi:hemerythrin-like metal-binding protein|nr:hemerythrin family protein [Treponema sp.]